MPKSTSLVDEQFREEAASQPEEQPVDAPVQEAQDVSTPKADTSTSAAQLDEPNASLETRLAALEARLLAVESKAHIEHQMTLGPAELQAIGKALEQQIKQNIVDVLRAHLGMAPPAIRGDGS